MYIQIIETNVTESSAVTERPTASTDTNMPEVNSSFLVQINLHVFNPYLWENAFRACNTNTNTNTSTIMRSESRFCGLQTAIKTAPRLSIGRATKRC